MRLPNTTFPRPALAGAVALALAAAGFTPRVIHAQDEDPRVDDRLIVHLLDDVTVEAFIEAVEANNPTIALWEVDRVPSRPVHLLAVDLPPDYDPAFVDALELDLESNYHAYLYVGDECEDGESCVSVDFVYLNQTAEGRTGNVYVSGIEPGAFDAQYALPLMSVDDAQERTTGLGTVVAVLDTGIDDTHPRLAGRVLPYGWNFTGNDGDTRDRGDGVDNDGDHLVDEMTGHGTYVAGLIAQVAPDTRLLPVRILDSDGGGDEWMLVRGLYYAIDRGVEVINVSLGSTYDTMAVMEAIAEAATRGIVVTAAAGNLDRSDPRERPAMDDAWLPDPGIEITGAFGVAATDHEDVKAGFSNHNRRLFISAPGDTTGSFDPARAIVSTLPDAEYGAWKGTSFATAWVSGAAALVRSQHPEWTADLATYWAMERELAETVDDVYAQNPAYAPQRALGHGRLNIGRATARNPVAPARLGDTNNDGLVDFEDLLALLADWGETHSSSDLDGDGRVGFPDLLELLRNWGA